MAFLDYAGLQRYTSKFKTWIRNITGNEDMGTEASTITGAVAEHSSHIAALEAVTPVQSVNNETPDSSGNVNISTKVLLINFPTFSTLPQTVNDSRITSDMVVVSSYLSDSFAQSNVWTATIGDGTVKVSGVLATGASTSIKLYLMESTSGTGVSYILPPHERLHTTNEIPKNSDLNDYTTPGKYYVDKGKNKQIANAPDESPTGSLLEVQEGPTASSTTQFFVSGSDCFFRGTGLSGSWREWNRLTNQVLRKQYETYTDDDLFAFGYLTANSTQVSLMVPATLANPTVISDVTSIKLNLRLPTGGYFIAQNAEVVSYLDDVLASGPLTYPDSVKASGPQGMRIVLKNDNGFDYTDNIPLVGTISMSYSLYESYPD